MIERFWEIIKNIIDGLGDKDVSGAMEFDFDSADTKEAVMCFHTDEDGMIVISLFDLDQWSLVKDMADFTEQDVEEIVRGLDPTGPNVYRIDPSQIKASDEDDESGDDWLD